MKAPKIIPKGFLRFGIIAVFALSCRKNGVESTPVNPPFIVPAAPLQSPPNLTGFQPFPEEYSMNCSGSPIYGDTVIFAVGNGSSDYMLSPVNNPGPGFYYSWPFGLMLNDSTGTIDVTKSETGIRYYIEYVRNGANDTCISTLILTGAAYLDSIYTQKPNVVSTAEPYFEGNINMNNICNTDSNCHWVLGTDPDEQHIHMDAHNGFINLDQSLQDGVFGTPAVNGASVNAPIFYTLDNNPNGLQSLTVQLMYYDSASSIPAAIVAEIQNRSRNANSNQILGKTPAASRPPLIIITRYK